MTLTILLLLLLLLQGLSPTLSRDIEKRLSTGSDISGSSLDKILERSEEQRQTTPAHSSREESQEDMKTRRCGGWGVCEWTGFGGM